MIQESYRRPRAAAGFALARERMHGGLRDSLHAWRWPAGLLTALVLWLALVTVVGAATLAPRLPTDSGCAPSAHDGFPPQAQPVLRAGLNRL
jgi:hypothetical protein